MFRRGIVRGQVNLDEHDPKFCEDKYKQWGSIPECPDPQFAAGGPGVCEINAL